MKKLLGVLMLFWCNVGVAEDKIDKLINEKNFINKSLSEIKRELTYSEDGLKKRIAECIEKEEDLPEEMKSTICWHIGDRQRGQINALSRKQHDLEKLLNQITKEIHFAKIEQHVTESTLSECKETNYTWWTYCKGTYTWSDGDKYVGGWKEGKPHGQGTYTWASGESAGDKYVGEFKDGKYHGQGTYTKSDGTVEKGIWENGKLVEPN